MFSEIKVFSDNKLWSDKDNYSNNEHAQTDSNKNVTNELYYPLTIILVGFGAVGVFFTAKSLIPAVKCLFSPAEDSPAPKDSLTPKGYLLANAPSNPPSSLGGECDNGESGVLGATIFNFM